MKEVDSMKCNRRVLPMLLAICLVVALIPAVATAETTEYLPTEIQYQQIVSFADKDWVVLDRNMNEMVLLLKTPEDVIAYNLSGLTNAWDDSNAKAWCADFKATLPSAVSEVSFLTYDELRTYFANGSMDNLKATLADGTTKTGWWVRYDPEGSVSTGGDVFGIAVSDAGFVGVPHVATNYAARPVIRIPAQNIISVVSDGSAMEINVVPDTLVNVKISIPENEVNGGMQTDIGNYAEGNRVVEIKYQSAIVNSTINVELIDRVGNVVMNYEPVDVDSSDGKFTIKLPDGLVGWYSLRAYLVLGNAKGAIVKSSFNIEDSHGEVAGYEATVKGDVSVNFAIDVKEEVAKDPDAYVVVSTPSGSTTVKVNDMTDFSQESDDKSLLVSMKAPQMTDKITIQVHSSKGNGAEHTYTVREYVESVIKAAESVIFDESKTESERNNAHKERNFARHMLNYGAKAQNYFNYNKNDLADKNIGDIAQDPVAVGGNTAVTDGTVDGITYYGASLVMNNQTALRFYFNLGDGKNISDYTFKYNGTNLKIAKKNGMYYAEVSNIAPNMLSESFTIDISVGNASASVSYSPMDYIQRQYHNKDCTANLKAMLQALYNYHIAAVEYMAGLAN